MSKVTTGPFLCSLFLDPTYTPYYFNPSLPPLPCPPKVTFGRTSTLCLIRPLLSSHFVPSYYSLSCVCFILLDRKDRVQETHL